MVVRGAVAFDGERMCERESGECEERNERKKKDGKREDIRGK